MNFPTSEIPLNPIQLHLLKMFAFNKESLNLDELKSILVEFYRNKVDEDVEKLWEEKQLDNEKMEEILKFHKRTPYK